MKRKSPSTQPIAGKHMPLRTCVGCHQVLVKRELVRVVRTPQGNIEVDNTGKKAGRGAYLHPMLQCWELALKGNRLEHTLKGQLTVESREQLLNYARELPKGAN